MSATPELSKEQLLQSHVLNCFKCKSVITKHGSFQFLAKIRDWLCPVGRKLFDQAAAEESYTKRKMVNFPFVPKLYETVVVRVKDKYLIGKVIDKSISSSGYAMGYEVEVTVPHRTTIKTTLPPRKEYHYVNQQNIFKAEKQDRKPKEAQVYVRGDSTIRIGVKPAVQPTVREPAPQLPKIKIGGKSYN